MIYILFPSPPCGFGSLEQGKQQIISARPYFLLSGQSFQDPSELLQFVSKDPSELSKKYICTLCSKFSHSSRTNVRNHVESKHFPNMFSYACELCGQAFPSKNNVQLHRSRVHKNKSHDNTL